MTSIAISEITFAETIRKGSVSCIYRVSWDGKDCILKVFHTPEPGSYFLRKIRTRKRETVPFKCESTAYTRLKEQGLCDRGIIPDFYGLVEQIKPDDHLPYLEDFLEDTEYPNAILIEYVPDIAMIDPSNFSAQRTHKLRDILSEIHQAGVYHADPYPRNMMVQATSDRVL
ncbi:hypothetical protein P170DRAFT_455668 [Aspergillus steynii IBT 23096]|uniref:Protein kinase domain-containing protein n=1 Tax=Aspergillus steynii IBT 23096 TaxID=1392250 RepID=A0A2I2G7H5_9EURO|nr:uncharacterized protein P170DRAFT_455668 [Aspergillus steynii IBT 23096]PLB48836.1 hypothetical protein P170DRAFT_455668 [Aspergillus steynii IBT 23096]